MKRLLITLMATAAVAGLVPSIASAHPGESDEHVSDGDNGGRSYADFNAEFRHIVEGIQHGVSDGSYSPYEADGFYRQMQRIRQRAYYQQVRGYYDPDWTQNALASLHDRMHAAHERGHERQDHYYANRYGYDRSYAPNDYSSYGYRQ